MLRTATTIVLLPLSILQASPAVPPATQKLPHYVRVDFNDLKSGLLAEQSSGEGLAQNANWSVHGSINIIPDDLQMPALKDPGYILSQKGTPSHIAAAGEGTSQAIRPLATPMNGQIWFSFLVKQQHATAAAGIKLLPSADPAQGYQILTTGTDISLTGTDVSPPQNIKNVLPLGKTSVVIGRLDVDSDRDKNRTLSLWVNPDVLNLGKPLIQHKLPSTAQPITHLALLISPGKNPASSPQIDEIILSNYPHPTSYYNVAPRKRHIGKSHIPIKAADAITQLPPPGYQLVLSDEFDAKALDHSKWDYRLRDKPDSAQEAENVEIRDGNLIIHARKQRIGKYNYTGGGIISKQRYVYGYYEARFKIPAAEGWHTAFWTMPDYDPIELRSTEIDFCEQDSGDPNYFSLGLINHRAKGWNESNIGRWVIEDAPNMVAEYVTIAAEFTPATIRFYMNGRLAKEVDARLFPHGPATVQLSCIASRKKGDRFQDDAHLPSHATFDYVRVYQHPQYAAAEAAAKTKAVLPTKPLPPLSERQRLDAKTGTLD